MAFKAVKCLQQGGNEADPTSFNTNEILSIDCLHSYLDAADFVFWWLKLELSVLI